MESLLNRTFGALANPTRRAIRTRLASGEATVTDLAEPFEMSGPAISKHLKVLEGGRLNRAGARGAMAAVSARCPTSERTPPNGWRNIGVFWEQSFNRLDDYLRELQVKEEAVPPGREEKNGPTK
ncbi:MAG: winged helix-turn-helix transcriptional regulator [Deltaproteobacteria bacterium]|nr:winged helix-turn-helix transcriptional regulator [Deltaproteobacteria bacterium]